MTTTAEHVTATTEDEAAVEAFVERFVTDLAGAASTVMTVIGDRLGLYEAMTGAGPLTADDLAAKTGLHPRLMTEWLAAQTVSEYVVYDPAAQTYTLPDAHAAALSQVDSPAYLAAVAEVVTGQFLMLDRLETAFRTDGAVPYDAFPDSMFDAVQRFFRTAYTQELAANWFPAVPGLVPKLERGARVADVGCGQGFATLLIGRTWPASTITGFDLHEPSIASARAAAIEAGSPENVTFRVADAADIGPGPYDVVVYFDSLHDMGDPPAALHRAYELLADGGIVVAVEPWSIDRLEDGIGNLSLRIDYSGSTSLCTPGSLAQPGRYGLGTLGGPSKRIDLLTQAGFQDAALVADTGSNLVLAARK